MEISYLSFNSNLVRLKHNSSNSQPVSVKTFQFQSGSIKTGTQEKVDVVEQVFQFQSGSIKTSSPISLSRWTGSVSIPIWFD